MLIGVPKEVKNHEYRVGLTPISVRELISAEQEVIIETGAGSGSGFSDQDYQNVGATIVSSATELFAKAELIVKVKEVHPSEYQLLQPHHIIFTYLHLAPDPRQAQALLESKAIALAYETVTDNLGGLPLLAPMSEVAGRMAVQVGAACLEKYQGGAGVLLGGATGVAPAKVVILGGGVVGSNAANIGVGMGARVTIIDNNSRRLSELEWRFHGKVDTVFPTLHGIETCIINADLVVGAVLVAGASAPKIITRDMLKKMRPGSVIVDVAIDQGGCTETSIPTTHDKPSYIVDDIVHYCVTNIPSAVSRTSTFALNNATLPFIKALAVKGIRRAIQEDPHLRDGVNICHGFVTHEAVAHALATSYTNPEQALN